MYVPGLDNNPVFPQFSPLQDWNLGEEAWAKASVKILFIFPSEMGVRSVSATHSCLYAIAKQKYGDDVFVDIWMEPVKYLKTSYEKTVPKYVVGFFSHHTWDDFDILGFSLAITMSEFIEVPVVMRKAGIPALSAERMADDKMPLICLGGIATDNSVVLNKYIDIYMLGLGERNIPLMIEEAFKAQAQFGSVGKGKKNIVEKLRLHTGFYDPSIYHYTHNVVNGHWESTYDSCDVPELEYIKPDVSLPAEVIKVADWQRKLSVPGGQHKVSLQSSLGCHGSKGTCNFCHEGHLYGAWRERTEEDYRQGIYESKLSSMGEGFSWFSFNGNFLNNYVQSLQDAAKYYHKIGSINIRIDSLAGSIKANGENNYIRLLKELGTTSVACLHGSTLVETKRGLIPIRDVKVGDEVVSLKFEYKRGLRQNPEATWNKVTHVLPRGVKNLYKFTTHDNHSFIATLDHVLPTCDCQRIGGIRDVEAQNLIGKRVLVRENIMPNNADNHLQYTGELSSRCKYQRPAEITPNLALLLGWLMGDGHVSGNVSRFYFGEKDNEAYFKIIQILNDERIPYSEEETPGVFGVVKRINVNAQGFTDFVQACGLTGSSTQKTFPVRIYTASTDCQLAFLSGYFSADGRCRIKNYCGFKSVCISVTSISTSIITGVSTLLSSLGMKNRIESKVGNIENNSSVVHKHPTRTINLKGNDSFKSFIKNISFLQSYKNISVEDLGSKRTVFCDTIEKVEFYSEEECWDLTIDGEPYFTANGIYVHNCPIEGISQRMRNWLNKNLTIDDILTVDAEVFKRRMIRLKHGLIWTGYETKEDYQEHEELYRKIIELRDMQGANTQLQANATWLVANYGTPLYYVPRKTTAMAWKQFFSKVDNKDFYFYPWLYLSDLGVKLKESSQPKDTIIQQSLQDCPGDFLDEVWVQPILRGEFENMSTEQVVALRKGFEKYGIKPGAQFLEYDANKNPRQHIKVGFMQNSYNQLADGNPVKYTELMKSSEFEGHGCCLKTPATVVKHNESKCVACGSCQDIDRERESMGLPKEADGKGHLYWMHNRPLKTDYNIMDVKTALMVNSPSFYYTAIFQVGESNRYISKEALVRKWLSRAAKIDNSLVMNFRTISYAFHKALDYEGLLSTYTGLELCQLGFKDALDIQKFKEIIDQVNNLSECADFKMISFEASQQSGGLNYKVLSSIELIDDVENVTKFINHLEEEHRIYEGSTSQPETFAMPFDYKVVRGKGNYTVYFLMPPRWNLTWSEGLKKYTANKVLSKVKNFTVKAIFNQTSDGRLINVLTGKVFETSGFIHIDQEGEGYQEKEDIGVDVDGS